MNMSERRGFLLLAIVMLVTAWNSYDFYHPDEHFQILEFGASKLDIVPTQNLPWEYEAGIRPWLQPILFAGLCEFLQFIGIDNRFLWAFFFRLFCAAWGFYAMLLVYRTGAAWLKDETGRRNFLLLCTTLGFLPFLLVRTSSENMSTSFFMIGIALLLKNYYSPDSEQHSVSPGFWLLSGLMLGLAFQFRYQTIIMTGGFCLWLLLIARTKWKYFGLFFVGFLLSTGIGLLADRCGTGKWAFPFFDYFRINLLENKTADFGTDPFFAYSYLVMGSVFAPVGFILMVSLLILWVRNPKHALSWITLPFFLFHCFIGHKEARFLFPLIPAAILSLQFIFTQNGQQIPPAFLQTGFWRGTCKWLWRYNWFWFIALSVFPFTIDYNINHQKFVYDRRDRVDTYYAAGFHPYHCKELIFSLYKPENLHILEVGNLHTMADIIYDNPTDEIYFFARMPYLDNWPNDLAHRTTIVNSSHFFFEWSWFVERVKPILKYIDNRINEVECPTLFRVASQGKNEREESITNPSTGAARVRESVGLHEQEIETGMQ